MISRLWQLEPISYIHLLWQLVFNAQAGLVLKAARADTCGSVQSLKKHGRSCSRSDVKQSSLQESCEDTENAKQSQDVLLKFIQ